MLVRFERRTKKIKRERERESRIKERDREEREKYFNHLLVIIEWELGTQNGLEVLEHLVQMPHCRLNNPDSL